MKHVSWQKIAAATACCVVGIAGFLTTWVECSRHGEASMGNCASYASRNPYAILSLLLLIVLAATSTRRKDYGARKILLWWTVLSVVFLGWFHTMV